jgi:hypothetical protein
VERITVVAPLGGKPLRGLGQSEQSLLAASVGGMQRSIVVIYSEAKHLIPCETLERIAFDCFKDSP